MLNKTRIFIFFQTKSRNHRQPDGFSGIGFGLECADFISQIRSVCFGNGKRLNAEFYLAKIDNMVFTINE